MNELNNSGFMEQIRKKLDFFVDAKISRQRLIVLTTNDNNKYSVNHFSGKYYVQKLTDVGVFTQDELVSFVVKLVEKNNK